MSDTEVEVKGFTPSDNSDVPIEAIREFFDYEAEILDNPRRIREWFELLTEDFSYEVPIRISRNSKSKEALFPEGSLHIYEDKFSMRRRVARFESGLAYGEEPPALLRRVIGGVRAQRAEGDEFAVRSTFLLYHNRGTIDGEIVAGERQDLVRVADGKLLLASRIVYLDHIVIPTQNVTFFF